jgi:L-ascorbate metabolism protein UlaG (beta-lactamase superfamily)
MSEQTFTYIGGATALLEFSGLRFLTDPSFDASGTRFTPFPQYTLERTMGPAVPIGKLPPIDAVLLSHDQHFDNLDGSGRAMLSSAREVITTKEGADRLKANAIGLNAWETHTIAAPGGSSVTITATPARHGPEGGDRGPVIGFILQSSQSPETVYISGDTVWFEGVEEVSRRFRVSTAILFMGAAMVDVAGPHALTMTADDAVKAAKAMPHARIVPLHFEGWKHFTQGRREIEAAFDAAGLQSRLVWGTPGKPIDI